MSPAHNHHATSQTGAIPAGQLCELCGMIAVATSQDEHGVTHYYCEHHIPKAKPAHQTAVADHDHSQNNGFDKHAGHSTNLFRERFWVSLLLTLPVMALSEFFQNLFGYQISFTGSGLVTAALGSIIFFYGGWVFIKSAWGELKAKLPGMMTLIALAITAAYLYSLAITFGVIPGMDFFWEVSSLITIMLLGHWIEMNSVSNAQNALGELAKLLPDTAELLVDGNTKTVPLNELKVDHEVLVRPGAKIPADGVIIKGSSSVNESMITGESKPVAKKVTSTVIAGTINGSGSLTVKVSHVGTDTALAGIMRLVAEAQRSKSRTQILADKAALYLTIIAIVVGIMTLNGWLLAGAGLAFALERLVSVLVITCPHALGLAVPLVTSISTSLSAKHGLLIRNRLALESARNIDVVLFDKTGTLTVGEQGVAEVVATGKLDVTAITKLAGALENDSEHSIGRAIVTYAEQKKAAAKAAVVTNWRSLPGQGVTGSINGQAYAIGGPQLLRELKLTPDKTVAEQAAAFASQGKTVIYLLENKVVVGLLTVTDLIRPESKEAVEALHQMGIKVAMVTGDSNDVAHYVATELNIDTVFAEVLPANKVSKVKELQSQGQKVAMVGDGVNDAPALTQADVGIAIGAGTDVAIESAGIILVKSDPRAVVSVFTLARATYRKMIQNLVWATGYNVLAIPVAAGVFVNQGITLQPAVAAIFMSLSTVIVAANAQLLRKIRL